MESLKSQLLDLLEDADQEHDRLTNLIKRHDDELKAQRTFIEQLSKHLAELQASLAKP